MSTLQDRMQPNGLIKILLPDGEVYEIPTNPPVEESEGDQPQSGDQS